MKITRHTAGGYCPGSSAGTAIPDPLQLTQGADMHLGVVKERSLPDCPCWPPGHAVSSAEGSKCISCPLSVKVSPVGITELLSIWFIVSVREWGALTSQGTVGNTWGKLGLAQLDLKEAIYLQLSCAGAGAGTCPTAGRGAWPLGEEFWRMAGSPCLWTAHLPKSWHWLELAPWGC